MAAACSRTLRVICLRNVARGFVPILIVAHSCELRVYLPLCRTGGQMHRVTHSRDHEERQGDCGDALGLRRLCQYPLHKTRAKL